MCRSLEEKAKRNQIMFLRRINDRLSGAVGGKGEERDVRHGKAILIFIF